MHYTSPAVYQYISKKNNDPIVERKRCRISGTRFPIYKSDLDFYSKTSPVFGGMKYKIPPPTLCPEERQRRRILFRNESKLYKTTCRSSGESIISLYSPDKKIKVFDQKKRWSKNWSGFNFAIETISFNQGFSQQFRTIRDATPHFSIYHTTQNSINCDYTNYSLDSKNCHLCASMGYCESCFYCNSGNGSNNCFDSMHIKKSSQCYECIDITGCSNLFRSVNCSDCHSSIGLSGCKDCKYCINCTNLSGKRFFINNRQFTKEDFKKAYKEKVSKKRNIGTEEIKKDQFQVQSERCIGNNIMNSYNSSFVFDIQSVRESKYTYRSVTCDYTMDTYGIAGGNYTYEVVSGRGNKLAFSMYSYDNNDSYYTFSCFNSSHLFGCIGLRNASYCIFNKQYTKKEYETLVPKIITHMQETGEWGEFFDPSLSPFGYNETVAQEYFPLTRDEALARGHTRQDNNYDPVIPPHVETLTGEQIPNDITTVTDDILKKICVCEVSGRPYRIIKQELEFYRKYNIPLPRKHPDIRHEERMKQRPGRTLYLRNCDKTGEEIISVYPEDSPFKVYSEAAYQQEVYG